MPEPIHYSALGFDLTPRVVQTTTVVASPTDSTEVIVASVALTADISYVSGVLLFGWAAFTVGTNGVTANLRARTTTVSGTTKVASGATTVTAAQLVTRSVQGFDTAPAAGQVYKLTLEVGSASAGSTVSAVSLVAIAL